jgi:alpha/beta hydrolase fold
MKSISFYIVTAFIRLKGIKAIFSVAPIDYLKLRKSAIQFPNKKILLNQDTKIGKINKSILTEIIPVNSKSIENIILYCPSGAFVYGPTDVNWKFAAAIAKKTNLNTFVIDYPKAPEFKIEEINTNIDAVYNHLAEQKKINNPLCG